MNKKKIVAIIATIAIAATMFAGCGKSESTTPSATSSKKDTKVKIGLSTDKGGRGDKSFNDAAIAGLDKIAKEYTITPDILEAKKIEDYTPFLTKLAGQDDLVFGVGFAMQKSMEEVAKANPTKKFGLIDEEVKLPNVVSLKFKEHEGSFLMGVIAGKTTKTNKVGFIGGVDMPLIQKFEAGFIAGVMSVNPDAAKGLIPEGSAQHGTYVKYTGAFDNSNAGQECAKNLYNAGCDVVFHAAGACGIGLIKEASDERKAGKDVWAIGVDSDQAVIMPDNASAILSSMVKRVDNATYDVSKSVIDGTFKGGTTIEFGLKENGVGMADTTKNNTKADVVELANKYKDAIVKGTIIVPSTIADAKNFKPVQP